MSTREFLKWCEAHGRDGPASIRAAADETPGSLDELRKRAEQPERLVKADVQSRLDAELERRRALAGFPSDPRVLQRLLRDLLAEPVAGPWAHLLDPSRPPRPTWGDVLSGVAADPDQQRSLAKAATEEQAALSVLKSISQRLRAANPRLTEAKAMAEAMKQDPAAYTTYAEAQARARRVAGGDS